MRISDTFEEILNGDFTGSKRILLEKMLDFTFMDENKEKEKSKNIKCKIFIGNIDRCTKIKRDIYGGLEGFGTVDSDGPIKIEKETYKKDAILLEVDEDKFVDYSYFTSFGHLKEVVECVSTNTPLDNVILKTSISHVGSLFIDPTSLKPINDIETAYDEISCKKFVKTRKKQTTI